MDRMYLTDAGLAVLAAGTRNKLAVRQSGWL